jgi:hypothetical protein
MNPGLRFAPSTVLAVKLLIGAGEDAAAYSAAQAAAAAAAS